MSAVVLFVPCYVDQLAPAAGIAALEVLEKLADAVEIRPRAVCCGQPFTNSGCAEQGEQATSIWFREMQGCGRVVVLSSSCTVHLRHWQQHHPATQETATQETGVYEFCEFLEQFYPECPGGELERTVCLHSSCHGLRDSQANHSARAILARIKGLTTREAERADECCGFGGTFSTSYPELSVRMGSDRLQEIEATGVNEVVATDVSCLLHLQGIARSRGQSMVFRHIAEVLREALL